MSSSGATRRRAAADAAPGGARLADSPTERFDGTLAQRGRNPYLEVPADVSAALAAWASAGRIAVEGRIAGAGFRTTLVPVGEGRHRLYVNGGMRAASGVRVGDPVRVELRAVRARGEHTPDDLETALAARGMGERWAAQPAGYRRELVRWIDDARSPGSRRRRIADTLDRLDDAGPAATPATRRRPTRELWTCPRCGNRFVNRNQWHSCRRYTLDDTLAGVPPGTRRLVEAVRRVVHATGGVQEVYYRDRIAFMSRVRFAGVTPRQRWVELGLWLTRRVPSERFRRVETITPDAHVHTLRVRSPDELDAEVAAWIAEAAAVGRQEHLGRGSDGEADAPVG